MTSLNLNNIFLNKDFKNKDEIFKFLSEQYDEKSKNEIYEAFLERENQISTGLEDGFAIPHAKSKKIKKPVIIFISLKREIEWETFDGKGVKYIIALFIPGNGGEDYLQNLASLSSGLLDEMNRSKLKNAKSKEEVYGILTSFFVKEDEEEKIKYNSEKIILGIVACPAGIAHTYMAKKSIEDACNALGYKCKIEAHGTLGIENPISQQELENGLFFIKAVDVEVDENNRFNNLFRYECSTNDFIKNKSDELKKALVAFEISDKKNEKKDVSFKTKKIDTKQENTKMSGTKRFGRDILKHLMTGIGFCIPLLAGCGFMIAISQLLALFSVEDSTQNFPSLFSGSLDDRSWIGDVKGWNGFLWTLYFFGMNIGLGYLFITMFGGFIGYSINGRAGFAPGLIAGFVAIIRNTGFIGALLTSLVVGYLVKYIIKYLTPKGHLRVLGSVIFVPLFGVLLSISLGWWVFGFPLEWFNMTLQSGIKSLSENGASLTLICVLLCGMMAFDLGGPINKSALAVGIFLYQNTENSDLVRYVPWAAIHIGIGVPALGIAIGTWIAPNYFTSDEKIKANTSFMTALFGISEGALPFLMKHPLRSILVNVTGAIIGCLPFVIINGELSVGAGVIFGWIFASSPLIYILANLLGAVWVGIGHALFQKLYFHKKTQTKWVNFLTKESFSNKWIGISNIFKKKNKKRSRIEDKFVKFKQSNNINIDKIENY